MGRTTLAALLMITALSGCAVTATSPGYDGERTGPNTNYSTYVTPGRPPYRDTYIVTTPGNGARVIVDERYEPRPSKK